MGCWPHCSVRVWAYCNFGHCHRTIVLWFAGDSLPSTGLGLWEETNDVICALQYIGHLIPVSTPPQIGKHVSLPVSLLHAGIITHWDTWPWLPQTHVAYLAQHALVTLLNHDRQELPCYWTSREEGTMINGLSRQGFIFSPTQLPGSERHLLIDIISTLRPSY
jgi:hypothetical protein